MGYLSQHIPWKLYWVIVNKIYEEIFSIRIPPALPSGKGLYLTIYPSSGPHTFTISTSSFTVPWLSINSLSLHHLIGTSWTEDRDGLLLHDHGYSLCSLWLHLLLPHLSTHHDWPGLLCKVSKQHKLHLYHLLTKRCCDCLKRKKVPPRKPNETESWLNNTAFPDLGER